MTRPEKRSASETDHGSRVAGHLVRRHAGIVLAAGASSRMGQPKALLELPDGRPLAQVQSDLLKDAGCERVVVVLGCSADSIQPRLAACKTIINETWSLGRLGSVQAGFRALPGFDGYVILPVDTTGVRASTIARIIRATKAKAVRPQYDGAPGRLVWVSAATAATLLAAHPSARMDAWLARTETVVEVDDPAVIHNVNTPDEWSRWLNSVGKLPRPC